MNPSVLSTSSTLTRSLEAGVETFDLLRICALWMRAIISPSGSFKAIDRASLPARFDKPRDHALGPEVPERDAGQLVLAIEGPRSSCHFAAVAHAGRRGIARKLGELQSRGEPLFHRLSLVARGC